MLNDENFIGFYHENEEYGFMSNWYPSAFEYAGKKYANIEQYMMYQKMMTFSQYEIADRIMETSDPAECKRLGRSRIDNWDGDLWDKISYAVVKRGIKAKFFQNKDILEKLLYTDDMLLAECAPNDNKWGIGIAVDDERRFDVNEWTGQNLLGRILMDVRGELGTLHLSSVNGVLKHKYRDVRNMGAIPEWKMTIGELLRIPKYHNTVAAYAEVCRWFCGNHKYSTILDIILDANEDAQLHNMGGGLPPQGFWELKQDIYDIAKDMFVNASGFDAPVYGTPVPEGTKFIDNGDGTMRMVKPGEEENK